jgi:large subunit ribosomal protein L1
MANNIAKALEELRATKKRKFMQTIELIINLKGFDNRREKLNTFITLPNPAPMKIGAFLKRKSPLVNTILESDFDKYKSIAEIKQLANKYDLFIAVAPLMPKIATKFGRVFGPLGKMPSPQVGIVPMDSDEAIKPMLDKIKKSKRIITKEPSIKLGIGKEDMSDKEIIENIESVVKSIEHILPKQKENIRNVLLKFTMSKPIKLEL